MTLGSLRDIYVWKKILTSPRWKSLSVPSSLDRQPFDFLVLSKKLYFDRIDLILFILFEKIGSQTLTTWIQSLTG